MCPCAVGLRTRANGTGCGFPWFLVVWARLRAINFQLMYEFGKCEFFVCGTQTAVNATDARSVNPPTHAELACVISRGFLWFWSGGVPPRRDSHQFFVGVNFQ